MNLFRKILLLLLFSSLLVAVRANDFYPSLKKNYSQKKLDSLITEYKEKKDAKGLAIAFELKGVFFQHIYYYSSSTVSNFYESAENYFKINDLSGYYRVKKRIADLYSVDDVMYKYAIDYYKEALGFYHLKKDKVKIAGYKLDLLNVAINKDTFSKKEDRLISWNREKVLKETINDCKKLKDQRYLTYAYSLYGAYWLQKENLNAALKYTEMSLAKSQPRSYLKSLNLLQKGKIKKLKNDFPGAIKLFEQSELIAEVQNNKYLIQLICKGQAECYTAMNNTPKAVAYWQKTAQAIEKYYNSGQTQITRSQEISNALKDVIAARKLILEKKRNRENLIYFLVTFFLVTAGAGFWIVRVKLREKDLINQQQRAEMELKSMKSLIDGQEKERNRVAKDLHDGLGAHLSSIKLFIESQKDKYESTIQGKLLEPLAKNIDEACLETRNISHDLRPFALKFGFNAALGDLVKKAQNTLPEVEVVFEHFGEEPQISEEVALMVYRVVQELLNNAAKYSKATQITVQAFYEPSQISVNVEDDGLGFDINVVKEGNGLGNIRSRVDYLDGQVIWQSAPNQGTAVIISIPIMATHESIS
ncbi:sensor histidine kinase [Haliscomenobacter sp.]|uniref:sensor histidine kinase n=1 Tax=Haliscomenobacter sp. TaxID=2717303 RepID=UPI003364E6D4